MVSDTELIVRLREFLSTCDLNTTTTAIVRRRLEEDFGIDLSDRKAFIRHQVDDYLQSRAENGEEGIDGEGGSIDGGEGEEMADEEVQEEHEEEENERGAAESAVIDGKCSSSSKTEPGEIESKKRGGGGFTKPSRLSPELQKFTGVPEMARTQVVKLFWDYIKKNNLQDPSNRRNIICDDTLRSLFCVHTIDMFQMNKAIANHIWPLDSNGAPVSSANPGTKEKQPKREREKDEDEPKRKKNKKKRVGNSALLAPLKLSDALVKFLGSGESELPRSDVVKRIWDHIKLNNLQDPSDKREIICDEKLKELLNVDTFRGFTVSKLLTTHFVKKEQ